MAHGRHGAEVNVPRIGKDRSPVRSASNPPVNSPRTRQVIVAELVEDQGQDQFRFLGRGAKQAGRGQRAQQEFSNLGSFRVSPRMAAAMLARLGLGLGRQPHPRILGARTASPGAGWYHL